MPLCQTEANLTADKSGDSIDDPPKSFAIVIHSELANIAESAICLIEHYEIS